MENEVQKKGKKKLLPLLLILLLLLGGGGIFAATQLLGGPKYGPEVDVSDFQTLKEAIETTEEGQARTLTLLNDIKMEDTITLPEGVEITIKDDGTARTLVRDLSDAWMFWVSEDSKLTIQGSAANGVVLDGASGTMKAGPDGALIISEYGEIVLDNVVMKDNRSNQGLGGMMRLVGCDLTATNSTFTNGASKSGGVVYAVESNVSFTDCDLSKNSAVVGHGGAVYVDNASELTLERCTLNNNEILTGAGYGGAVIVTNFSHATINDCTMDNNVLDHDGFANGGAMYIAWGSVVDVTNTTFNNNSVTGTENHLGGAIYINEGSTVNVGEGVKFIGNKASHGGAIYAIDTATVNLDGAYFEDNHTTIGNGGAIYCWRDPVLNAKNTTFIKNYTKAEGNAYGGAVALATGAPVGNFENCTFEGNYTDNVGFCNGGALLVGEGATVTMIGENSFKDNWGKSTGGKNTCGGAIYVSKASLSIDEGTTFTGNYGTHGGAIYVNYAGLLEMTGVKFDNNYSYYGHGGALCAWNGGEVKATSCSFTNNQIKSTVGGYGGAVAIYNKDKEEYNSVGTFNNCTFVNNKTVRSSGDANANGGAIYAGMGGDVYVNGGSFKNNYARTADLSNASLAWRGGAIYANTNSTLKVNGASFTGNSGQYGGAIFAQESAVLSVTNSTFTGNNTTDKGSHGGAIYVNRMPATITGCKFTENWAQGIAGAVMLNGKENTVGGGTIKNCTFTKNYTPLRVGGAVAAYDGLKVEIVGSTFNGNYTNYSHGGAVYTQNMPAVIKNSTFTGNYIDSAVAGYGGAVAIVNDSKHFEESSGTITDCVFTDNFTARTEGSTANANGGALYFGLYTKAVVDGETSFNNNFAAIADDSAKSFGGAIYVNTGCNMTVGEKVTFTGNASKFGGAIGMAGAAGSPLCVVNLNGPTMTGNTATEYGGAVYFDAYGDLSINGLTVTSAEGVATPDFLIRAGQTLDVQGKVVIDSVKYENTTSMLHLDGALEEGSLITIIPSEYTEGLQVVTAEEVVIDNGDGTQTTVNLLEGIGAKVLVATDAENRVWVVDDEGKLADKTPTTYIGETPYLTLADALAAAQDGDRIELRLDDVLTADATIPAGALLVSDGKTLTVADGVVLTVSDNAVVDGVVIAGNVTAGSADLSKATVTGKVTVAENATLTVGGDFTAAEVALLAGAKVNVASALTNAPAFRLTSAVETAGTVLVTAPDAEATKAAVAAIDAQLLDTSVVLGEDGIIAVDSTVATITKDGVTTKYDTINEAIAAAANGDTIVLVKSLIQEDRIDVTGGKVITIDGNGNTITRGASRTATMVYVYGAADATGNLTLTNITLDGNQANCAATEPMILIKAGSTVKIGTGTVITNAYRAGAGGAVHNSGTLTVNEATFTNNGSALSGGAIFNNNGATMTIANTVFTDNYIERAASGSGLGGAVYNHETATASITGCTFENNRANNVFTHVEEGASADTIAAKSNMGLGGAIMNNGGPLTLSGNTFKNNYASQAGGAIYLKGAVTLENNTFTGNQATATKVRDNTNFTIGGAAIAVNAGTLTVKDGNVFENNGAASLYYGGAIIGFYDAKIIVEGGTFTGNQATQGAVIYNSGTLEIKGGTFEGNAAADAGGVISQPAKATAVATISGGTFKSNSAVTNGGVIFNHTASVVNISGGTFDSNKAQYGGVIRSNGGPVTITGGTFNKNAATADGGVIYMRDNNAAADYAVLTVSNAVFTNNNSKNGVVLHNIDSHATFDKCVFEGNEVNIAGGVGAVFNNAKDSGTPRTGATITVTNSTLKNNKALSSGGIYFAVNGSKGVLNMENCLIEGNQGQYGGAIYNHTGCQLTLTKCTFLNNKATNDGGAFVNNNVATVTDCDFDGNTAAKRGGAIFFNGVTLTIDADSTFGATTANTDTNNGTVAAGRANDLWLHKAGMTLNNSATAVVHNNF